MTPDTPQNEPVAATCELLSSDPSHAPFMTPNTPANDGVKRCQKIMAMDTTVDPPVILPVVLASDFDTLAARLQEVEKERDQAYAVGVQHGADTIRPQLQEATARALAAEAERGKEHAMGKSVFESSEFNHSQWMKERARALAAEGQVGKLRKLCEEAIDAHRYVDSYERIVDFIDRLIALTPPTTPTGGMSA